MEINGMFRVFLLALVFLDVNVQAAPRPRPSDGARAETLQNFKVARTAESAARRKTGIVLTGQGVNPFATTNEAIDVVIRGQTNSHLGAAMAAAIDRRGYFLTAAHVADDEPLSIVFCDGEKLRALPARVVAKISNNHKQAKLDIAVLHVDAQLGEVFEWADERSLRRSDVLLEIGRAEIRDGTQANGVVTNAIVAPAAFAGKFKKTAPLRGGGTAFRTVMPVRGGDSGGPVLTLDGKLIGIACGAVYPFFGRDFVVANRPDFKWLDEVMKVDFEAKHEPTAPSGEADSGEAITITVPLLLR